MDVTERLDRWRSSSRSGLSRLGRYSPAEWTPELLLKAANAYLRPAVIAALVLLIAYQVAALTRAMLSGEDPEAPFPVTATFQPTARDASRGPEYAELADAHLFGTAPVAPPLAVRPVAEEVDAPETTLSLRLTGIVFGEGGVPSLAQIASGRNEETAYRVGEVIDGTGGATLHAVYHDRVILDRDGRLETLSQPTDLSAVVRGTPSPAFAPTTRATRPLREALTDGASQLMDVVRFTPHIEGGRVIGVRVNPARNRQAFADLGLMPGDVVTDINGTVLDDQGLVDVFEALSETTVANVTVLRDGVPQILVIDSSRLQGLDEDESTDDED